MVTFNTAVVDPMSELLAKALSGYGSAQIERKEKVERVAHALVPFFLHHLFTYTLAIQDSPRYNYHFIQQDRRSTYIPMEGVILTATAVVGMAVTNGYHARNASKVWFVSQNKRFVRFERRSANVMKNPEY